MNLELQDLLTLKDGKNVASSGNVGDFWVDAKGMFMAGVAGGTGVQTSW